MLVLTTTSATLILSRAFGADCMTRITYIYSSLPSTHSLTLRLTDNPLSPFRLTEATHTLSYFPLQRQHTLLHCDLQRHHTPFLSYILTSSSQPHENVYIFNLFLSCSTFSVRFAPASNTTTEISSNPERDKQPTWEKTRCYISIYRYLI